MDKNEERLYRDRNMQIIFGVTLLAIMGVSSIAPALPAIRRDLGISDLDVSWLIIAFTLPGMILSPFIGVLADRVGRKRILVPSLFLFGIAGAACALTSNFGLLVALRVLQGLGAVVLGVVNVTIIGDLYSGKRLAAAMGLNASVLSIGTGSLPLIGGALAYLGWQYPFYLSLLAIPMGFIVITSLRNPEPRVHGGLREYLLGAWRCLKDIRVAALFAAGVLTFVILYGAMLTYFTLLLDESFGASALTIGLVMAFTSLATAIVSFNLGRVAKWFSGGTLIKAAFVLYGLSLVLVPLMPNLWFMLIPMLIFGVGQGINLPTILTLVAGMAPMEYRAAFMALNSGMLRMGQTIGPPLVGICYVYGGSETAFYITAVVAFGAALIGVVGGGLGWGRAGGKR